MYRFRARQVGTYWYHSHEMSSVQVRRGLFGALVVLPADAAVQDDAVDETVLRHTWGNEDGVATLGLAAGVQRRPVPAGRPVRLRLVNTGGNPATFTLTGAPVRVVAIDGIDVHEPGVLAVEETTDGTNWRQAWEVPDGRRAFLARRYPELGPVSVRQRRWRSGVAMRGVAAFARERWR